MLPREAEVPGTHFKTIRSLEVKGLLAEEKQRFGLAEAGGDGGAESRHPEGGNAAQPLLICGYLG